MKNKNNLTRFFFPSAFTVAFAFLAGILGLYYTAKTPECFTACGWPIQYVTQIPYDSVSVKFSINFAALAVVWLFWYAVACTFQWGFFRVREMKSSAEPQPVEKLQAESDGVIED